MLKYVLSLQVFFSYFAFLKTVRFELSGFLSALYYIDYLIRMNETECVTFRSLSLGLGAVIYLA